VVLGDVGPGQEREGRRVIFSIIINFEAEDLEAASGLTNAIGEELARVCGSTVHISDPAVVMPLVIGDEDAEC